MTEQNKNNRVALVTGASKGIGMPIAIVLLFAAIAGLVGSAFAITPAVAGDASTRVASAINGNHPQCGTQTIDLNAPVISSTDVLIEAPIEEVWAIHTDLAAWPSWNQKISYVKLLEGGPLRVGSRFQWENGGLRIASTVLALNRNRCTLWGGPGGGINGVHLWTFTPVKGGTLVHTEESWSGAIAAQDPKRAKSLLDKSLASGANDLKKVAEARRDRSR